MNSIVMKVSLGIIVGFLSYVYAVISHEFGHLMAIIRHRLQAEMLVIGSSEANTPGWFVFKRPLPVKVCLRYIRGCVSLTDQSVEAKSKLRRGDQIQIEGAGIIVNLSSALIANALLYALADNFTTWQIPTIVGSMAVLSLVFNKELSVLFAATGPISILLLMSAINFQWTWFPQGLHSTNAVPIVLVGIFWMVNLFSAYEQALPSSSDGLTMLCLFYKEPKTRGIAQSIFQWEHILFLVYVLYQGLTHTTGK